jgi:hypothetical protein
MKKKLNFIEDIYKKLTYLPRNLFLNLFLKSTNFEIIARITTRTKVFRKRKTITQ